MMVELVSVDSERGFLTAVMRLLNIFVILWVLKDERLFNWQRTILFFPIIMIFGYLPGIWLEGYGGLPFIQAAMIATTARWVLLAPVVNAAFSSKYRATAISLLSLLIGVVYIAVTGLLVYIIPAFGIKAMHSLLGVIILVFAVPLAFRLLRIKSEV